MGFAQVQEITDCVKIQYVITINMAANDTAHAIARHQICDLVERLNRGPECWTAPDFHPKLVSLLVAWRNWIDEYQLRLRQWKHAGGTYETLPVPVSLKVPGGCPTVHEMRVRCRVMFTLNPCGERTVPGVYYDVRSGNGEEWSVWQFVARDFISLTQNPLCHMFGGPCARCGRFFLRQTAKQKRFCTAECARTASAFAATARRRESERTEKVRRVKKAIEEWESRKKKPVWQDWVRNKVPDVSKTWLTRAVNRRIIVPPKPVTRSLG